MNITDILYEISHLLSICNHREISDWLKQKAQQLTQEQDACKRNEILLEIKDSLAGMGSLSDIYLVPPEETGLSKRQANEKLGILIGILDQELRSALQEKHRGL